MSKKLGQEPAFPVNVTDTHPNNLGMSKRLYIATEMTKAILTGLYSNKESMKSTYEAAKENNLGFIETIVMSSYEYADELLRQENK